jgi:hypothetical protein
MCGFCRGSWLQYSHSTVLASTFFVSAHWRPIMEKNGRIKGQIHRLASSLWYG